MISSSGAGAGEGSRTREFLGYVELTHGSPPPPPPLLLQSNLQKVVHIATSESVRKQILRELQIMHDCSSPYIVSFYGAYLSDPHICMCMEFMDKSLVQFTVVDAAEESAR